MGSSIAQVQSPQSSSSGKSGSDGLDQNAINADPAGFANWQQQRDMQPQPSSGKGDSPGLQGSQGAVTFPSQGGQPEMGMPNAYSNTIGPGQQGSWDNSSNQSSGGKSSADSAGGSGKGKGA